MAGSSHSIAMRPSLIALAAVLLVPLPTLAQEWRYLGERGGNRGAEVEISVATAYGTKAGRLRLEQIAGAKGNLILVLNVLVEPDSGFKPDDFEGPDAPFGEQRLATLRFRSTRGVATVHCKGGGYWAAPAGFSFVVAISNWPGRIHRHVRHLLAGERPSVVFELRYVGSHEAVIRADVTNPDSTGAIRTVLVPRKGGATPRSN
jgi:hypothetical protein